MVDSLVRLTDSLLRLAVSLPHEKPHGIRRLKLQVSFAKETCNPHGIRRVSNPATRKDLAARTWGVCWY